MNKPVFEEAIKKIQVMFQEEKSTNVVLGRLYETQKNEKESLQIEL